MDYLKVYDDMSAFSVTIEKKFIDSTIDSLCNSMNFHISKLGTNYRIYSNLSDDRSFMLVVYYDTPFCGLSIKCETKFKELFFRSIESQLLETQSLWGIPYTEIDDYPDWLRDNKYSSICKNPIREGLKIANLIK